jgi:hypothetical protein
MHNLLRETTFCLSLWKERLSEKPSQIAQQTPFTENSSNGRRLERRQNEDEEQISQRESLLVSIMIMSQ